MFDRIKRIAFLCLALFAVFFIMSQNALRADECSNGRCAAPVFVASHPPRMASNQAEWVGVNTSTCTNKRGFVRLFNRRMR